MTKEQIIEKEAIKFIIENPDCEKYWLSKVKHFLDGNGEPTDDSCQLADEWQKQFEIAMKAFLKHYSLAKAEQPKITIPNEKHKR